MVNVPILIRGAVAGCVATLPMTAVMFWLHRRLPDREKSVLPPRQITEEALQLSRLDDNLPEQHKRCLAYASHFSYGAIVGAVYSALPEHFRRRRPLIAGSLYGAGVWAANYLGLMPALGSQAAAVEDTPRRNGLMIASHLVWGASLGAVFGAVVSRKEASSADVRPDRRTEATRTK
jgi:uncharacterized membrane protein YagU involved in acid resistance